MTAPRPLPPCPVCGRPPSVSEREAAERADKAMRDVFGGVDQFGDYCGHPVMPVKLAYAVQDLLAAIDAAKGGEERLHPYADWHEDDGPVLWYAVPVEEPPYCGDPLCSDWPKEWDAPCDTVTGAFIDGPYTGKVLRWQRLPELPPDAALRSDGR